MCPQSFLLFMDAPVSQRVSRNHSPRFPRAKGVEEPRLAPSRGQKSPWHVTHLALGQSASAGAGHRV